MRGLLIGLTCFLYGASSALFDASLAIAKRCYTPRRRDEDLHNQQIFAVNYFEKYLPISNMTISNFDWRAEDLLNQQIFG